MTKDRPKILHLHPDDNVGVAAVQLHTGDSIEVRTVQARRDIPPGHKIALELIPKDAAVKKYGQIMGFALVNIAPGEHVHAHNVGMGEFTRDYAIGRDAVRLPTAEDEAADRFDGFLRENGRVGTRNYIGILATVSCSASLAHMIADAAQQQLTASAGFPNVDGILPLGHTAGCCSPAGSEDLTLLQQTLAGYARNPNFGGVLMVGLGCEVNLIDSLMTATGLTPSEGLHPLVIQDAGGTEATIQAGLEAIQKMLPMVNACRRTPAPVRRLVVGLECGGSDAYSGITANPALGAAVDLLVRRGGTAILSETPEIYGAEHLLTRRAIRKEVGEKLIDRIRWWEGYTARHGAEINNNPSPGNKAGGLTTILEKSLGAVAKGGTSPLVDVYRFAEPVSASGLVFMDTPGYDVVSVTGMIAGGANMVCFTTGRGTVCGFAPVPTLKLATHSDMYHRLHKDMDINCGEVLDGTATIQEMGEAIYRRIIDTASGKPSKSETYGFGRHEFVPWRMGAVL